MLRSTIHLPPIEEGEFLLCYVKYAVLLILDEPITVSYTHLRAHET